MLNANAKNNPELCEGYVNYDSLRTHLRITTSVPIGTLDDKSRTS